MRKCIKCHEPKDESEFYHPPFHQNNICIACHKAKGRKDRAEKRASKEAIRLAQIEAYCRIWNEKERIG